MQFFIKAEKQENGLWPMPIQCVKIDRILINLSKEKELKHSAFCNLIAQEYPNEKFEICFTNHTGFTVHLNKSGFKRLNYADFRLTDNILEIINNT